MVAVADERVVGFASSSPFRPKVAYDRSVETTVVREQSVTGRGLGTAPLEELLRRISTAAAHRAYALIALPNEPSINAHPQLGYREVGTLDEVGHKLGRFQSVAIMEHRLQ